MYKKCDNCQAVNAADALFCNRCGVNLLSNSSAEVSGTERQVVSELSGTSGPNAQSASGLSRPGWQPAEIASQASDPIQMNLYSEGSAITAPKNSTKISWWRIVLTLPVVGFMFIVLADIFDGYFDTVHFVLLAIPTAILLWIWTSQRTVGRGKARSTSSIHRGEVRGFRERTERKNTNVSLKSDDTIWTFRLERYQDGKRLSPIPVEMRGQSFDGFINEGDIVELTDRWRGEGLHKTGRVYNLTNGIYVNAKKKGLSIWLILWIIFMLTVFSAIAYAMITGQSF